VTSEFYEKPVAVGDFNKHCAQRRKYPVLLKIEFNNAVREKDGHNTLRHGSKKANAEKNQNPRIIPCKTPLPLRRDKLEINVTFA